MPLTQLPTKYQDWQNAAPRRAHLAALRAQIGAEGVAASDWLLPHLAHREGIYIFPNPWIPFYWHVSGQNPHHPNAVNYLVLGGEKIAEHRALYDYLVDSGTFKQISSEHGIFVLRRQKPEAADRAQAIKDFEQFSPLPAPPFANVSISPSLPTGESEFRRLDIDLRAFQRQAPEGSITVSSPKAGTMLDLDLNQNGGGNFRTRYVRTELHSPHSCKARLLLGSDDGITVWLNGKQVHENIVLRAVNLNDDTADLSLKPGKNVLAFRINNATGGWALQAMVKVLECRGK